MVQSRPGRNGKRVLMGRIGSAHGIKGEVRIQSYCATPLDIASYGPFQTNRDGVIIEIAKARMAKDMVVASLKGVTDRNLAESLNGIELFVDRDRLPPAEGDEDFYYADLVGLAVQEPDGRTIGTISALDDFGAGDVVEIALSAGGSVLYAFTKANFPTIAVAEGYVVLDPPNEVEVREQGDA